MEKLKLNQDWGASSPFSQQELDLILRALRLSNGALWDEFWDNEREELLDWHLDLESLKGRFVWNSYEEPVPIDPYLKRKILQEALLTLWNAGEIELSAQSPGGNGNEAA